MYKNFNLTKSEREEILNRHKEYGYRQPLNEQQEMGGEEPLMGNDYEVYAVDEQNDFLIIVKNKRTNKFGVYDSRKNGWLESIHTTYNDDFKETNTDLIGDSKLVTEFTNSKGDKFYTLSTVTMYDDVMKVKLMNQKEFESMGHNLEPIQNTSDDVDRVYEESPLNESQVKLIKTFKRFVK
jgi:hypothetical protein